MHASSKVVTTVSRDIGYSVDISEDQKVGEKKQIMDWITSLNFFQRQADIFSLWQPGTGQWLLSDPKFYTWESVPGLILWCRGIRKSPNI
jgi:hypothetical protein